MVLFATLSDLKDAIRDECERRTHARFDAAIPRFVAGAEQRMWHGSWPPLASERLRLREMEAEAVIAVTDGEGQLPEDYLEGRRLIWTAGEPRTAPKYEAPDVFYEHRYALTTGYPVRYTIEGGKILFSPQITGELKLLYYAEPAPLVEETDTNAVLEKHPMLYFHAALIEAYRWLRNDAKMQEHFGNYTALASGLLHSDRRARQGANQLAMRIPNWRAR
jgi:hypothetical protein